jgi:hypothetical protein
LALPEKLKLLGDSSRYSSETILTEIRQAANNGATELHIFLHGKVSEWEITSGALIEYCTRWKEIYTCAVLVIDKTELQNLPEIVQEDLWLLHRFGIKIAPVDNKLLLLKNGAIVAQVLTGNSYKTFACTQQQAAIPSPEWMQGADNMLIHSTSYPAIALGAYVDEKALKPKTVQSDVEVEISTECNGALKQFADKFWQCLIKQHQPLQQHINAGDELIRIHYSDRYLYSPWTVLLIAELIDGLKQQLKHNWRKPKIHIDSAPKSSEAYQKNGLLVDWLQDTVRLDVIEGYYLAKMDENCTTQISSNTPHGRIMTLHWKTGKITTIRLDQGVSYWVCDVKPPSFDKSLAVTDQVDNMMLLIPKLSVKNHKDYPTQVFVKERDK